MIGAAGLSRRTVGVTVSSPFDPFDTQKAIRKHFTPSSSSLLNLTLALVYHNVNGSAAIHLLSQFQCSYDVTRDIASPHILTHRYAVSPLSVFGYRAPTLYSIKCFSSLPTPCKSYPEWIMRYTLAYFPLIDESPK